MNETVAITGAFSYTGKYTTRILLDRGCAVCTLTNHANREHSFGNAVQAFPCDFDHSEKLRETLRGASALINTYWVRFPRGGATFERAVENSRTLICAAKEAGVRRIVQVSIANPSLESALGYYRGKAQVEWAVMESGLSYCIVRPTVIFGAEDVLINNIAWFVRRFPVFAVPGDGRYALRPIYVEDMAKLLVDAVGGEQDSVINAVGPETFSFEKLVKLTADVMRHGVRMVHVPAAVAYASTTLVGWLVRDVVLTWEEYEGLMANLLTVEGPAAGQTRLSDWLAKNGDRVGRCYASEVARHYDKGK
jgi:nucleoside-diphosphate-sugar epimerase